jgi:ribose/xylose/arabinose/galactoside ABC-type transport system permease subunit
VLIRGGMTPGLAAPICIVAGAGLGLVNALLVQGVKIPAIIATLGTLSLYSGLGISIPRVRVQALVLMGVLCGIAGVLGLAFYDSGDPSIGTGSELTAIAAAIIGGTALAGGTATVLGAAVGAILLGVVSSALVFFNVPLNWSAFATGAVIIVAVGLDSLLRQGRRRRRARQL